MRPVVSVIIPIYNSEKYVVQCVESVLNQTLENIEIICVNDGSSDSSLELLKKLEKKDRRVVLVSQDNQGLSGARNTGMQYAQGQYMYFLDSDDWIEEIALDYMVQIADTKNYDVVMASYIKEFGDHSATVKIFNNSGEMELGG